jgi:hypothetical protein
MPLSVRIVWTWSRRAAAQARRHLRPAASRAGSHATPLPRSARPGPRRSGRHRTPHSRFPGGATDRGCRPAPRPPAPTHGNRTASETAVVAPAIIPPGWTSRLHDPARFEGHILGHILGHIGAGHAGNYPVKTTHRAAVCRTSAPPHSICESDQVPRCGPFFFLFQRGLAVASALRRLVERLKSVSERPASLFERPLPAGGRIENHAQ